VQVQVGLAAGETVTAEDIAPAACADRIVPRAFTYDGRSAALAASRDIAAGEIVLAPPSSLLAWARPSQAIRIAAKVGAVRVERQVVALQPGKPGEGLFVRDDDGRVFAVRTQEVAR
jgi:hypothetical protein